MEPQKNYKHAAIPLIIAVALAVGIFVGTYFNTNSGGYRTLDGKFNYLLNVIDRQYVDTVDIHNIVEQTIPKLLSNLDPHSAYIPAEDLSDVNSELEGSFSGIGITFSMMADSVTIGEVLPGGPAEKVGLKNGDRIVSVNDTSIVGMKQMDVLKRIRGEKHTQVDIGIKRNSSGNKIFKYSIIRDDIPVNTVDVEYMIEPEIGYIHLNKFGKNSYFEFLASMLKLRKDGARRYIIDVRGNGGGLMEPSIQIANEFLNKDNLIVFTRGREPRNDFQFWSDGNGTFPEVEFVVLIDEASASASEIFAGAMQDNDRALVIGRRTFGKGLIQQQIDLPDSSAIRLTVGRYYTPSGRCIQKDFKPGNDEEYSMEIYNRYLNGELYSKDSIKVKSDQIFETVHGRKVYGGGGIIPDIFVPNDTSGISSYYINVVNAGLLQKFAFNYADSHREALSKYSDVNELLKALPSGDNLLYDFVRYAAQNGVAIRWYYIEQSRVLLINQLRALIARELFGLQGFYKVYNMDDINIKAAVKALNEGKAAIPIADFSK
ncbi:MAG: S41 family peptidase [Muribaculaceae bacterium]|nr:S41 family peptidase [Muribaculaceae bacterium]